MAGSKARIIHQSNMPGDTHPLPRWLDKASGSLGFNSCNIANSAATEAAFSDYPDRYKQSLRRIDHGIDWRPAQRTRAEVLAALGVPDDGPVILSCARLVPQKRLHVIVEALALMPRGRCVVLGQGPERESLQALAARLGVAERLHLVGHVAHDRIHDIYAVSDIFAFPSEWETFGLAAVEATMHGVPIVANDLPALREVLRVGDGCIATLIARGQPADWAAALSAVSMDPQARKSAMAFAQLLREKYGIERMLGACRTLYREVLR
jgi:glycosyltransferase involved in cell wall biosynthesis